MIGVSEKLAANCLKAPDRVNWLSRLPSTVRELQHRWSLTPGEPFDDDEVSCAWVSRVTLADGSPAVMKVGMPHIENKHEIHGLRFWNGDSTVRLLDADEELEAMLLEHCEPGTRLRTLSEAEQDRVIARLLNRLWRLPSAPHPFRPLSDLMAYWAAETAASAERWPDAGLVREGLFLFEGLSRNSAAGVLLATDLHAGNVLQSRREPWLVIDPKPFVGDPGYDATQHLFNCKERLLANPHEVICRFGDLLGVDHERIRLWTFARAAAEPRENWSNDRSIALARTLGDTL
jgi:streptomycin 6-kinase